MDALKGQSAIVVGASSGMGQARLRRTETIGRQPAVWFML
jgi:NADP-dependent 3-hydroxy acid dehydrogenase YdfG